MAKKETQPVEEELALDVQLTKAEMFIEANLKKILSALAAVIVVAIAIWGWNNYKDGREADAQKAISAAQTAFAQQNYDKALNGDGTAKGFLSVIEEYGNTKTGNLAKLYAAICYANTEKTDDAIKYFEDFSQKDDMMVSPASIAALGNCYIEKGENIKGAELLIKAAKAADNDAVSPVFLLQAGEVYEAEGQTEKALELYQQIKKQYFNSRIAAEIEKYIIRATK